MAALSAVDLGLTDTELEELPAKVADPVRRNRKRAAAKGSSVRVSDPMQDFIGPWAQTPLWLGLHGSPLACKTFICISGRYGWLEKKRGGMDLSLQQMAKEFGMSVSTLQRGIRELEKLGILTSAQRGLNTPNIYRIVLIHPDKREEAAKFFASVAEKGEGK